MIETLKKEALQKAIEANKDNFSQNEYNIELLTIFRSNKKDTHRLKILETLRKQLMKQMARYGLDDFYSKSVVIQIKRDQIKRIEADLLEEKAHVIVYDSNYKAIPMTDVSISDIQRISYDELDRKIERLTFYLTRVQQRLRVLNNQQHPIDQNTQEKVKTAINRAVSTKHTIKADQ